MSVEGVVVQFDLGVFSVEAVKKAAYKYINKFSTDFALQGQSIVCSLIFTQNIPQDSIQFYIDDFRKEVLDQDLREKIKKESEPLRNLILAHAFSKTTLVEQ